MSVPKIAETLLVGMKRYFDSKIELYEVSYLLTRASYNMLTSHFSLLRPQHNMLGPNSVDRD